jgi:ferrochelatase
MKTLVLLVNFGGPRTLEEVPEFLKEMTGREATQAALEAVMERYRAIGGGSPLAAITDEQAALLAEETDRRFLIDSAYRYSRPSLEERIDEAYRSGVERLVFFVMSPYYTSRTTGGYVSAVEAYLAGLPYQPVVTFIHGWYNEPAFIDCWAARISAEDHGGESFYVFSAHSLPMSLAGEPYRSQVEETVRAVAARLRLVGNYALAWQSAPRHADEPWMGPSVEAVLDGLQGLVSRVVEVPIGFVSDHLETRYDMDIIHRQHALALGLQFSRVPSLNTYKPFIAALAVILEKSLGEGYG